MNAMTDFKTVHKLTIKDINRNYWLWGTVMVSLAVCLVMVFLGADITDKKRWMTYAVFLYITSFAMPLIYYIRFSDKNKRIINVMIHTKMRNIFLYQNLIGVYQVLIFTLVYGIVFLALAFTKTVGSLDVYLLVSVLCTLCILNGVCILCMNVIHRYYLALIVYMVMCVFLFTTNSLVVGLFFPMSFENNCLVYFVGKIIEVIVIGVANNIWIKRNFVKK